MDPSTERLDAKPTTTSHPVVASADHSARNWVPLVIGFGVAIGVWLLWVYVGIGCVHKQLDKAALQFANQGEISKLPSAAAPASASSAALAALAASAAEQKLANEKAIAERKTVYFTQVGQTGDAFGGLNAALTALAGALVFWAGFMQHQTLKHARAETVRLQKLVEEEWVARHKQEFESLFFRMLSLTREVTERIEVDSSIPRKGAAALDSFATRITDGWTMPDSPKAQLESLTDRFMKKVYETAPSSMGPYFRMLYQTFKQIDQSGLTYKERVPYANIARGQISEGAVLLLALNGWGTYGYKFIPYIEKYGLLEHMHPKYLQLVKAALRYGYRERAFLGSEERDLTGNEWHAQPHLKQFYPAGMGEARPEDIT